MKRCHFPRLALVAMGIATLAAGMLGAASPRDLVSQVQASADDTFIEINHPEGVRGTRAWPQPGRSRVAEIVGCAFPGRSFYRRSGTGTGTRPHLFPDPEFCGVQRHDPLRR